LQYSFSADEAPSVEANSAAPHGGVVVSPTASPQLERDLGCGCPARAHDPKPHRSACAAECASSGLKGHRLLLEFMRFRELATRESVLRDAAPARESLLGQLEHDLEVMREDSEVRSGQAIGKGQRAGKNLPASVEQILLARQVADKGGEALQSAKVVLSDLQGMERSETKPSDLLLFINDFQQQY
jgi:hypothetical protein